MPNDWPPSQNTLVEALNQAVQRSDIVVLAAGNNGGGRLRYHAHGWVIPVVACARILQEEDEMTMTSTRGIRGKSGKYSGTGTCVLFPTTSSGETMIKGICE